MVTHVLEQLHPLAVLGIRPLAAEPAPFGDQAVVDPALHVGKTLAAEHAIRGADARIPFDRSYVLLEQTHG